MLVFVNIFLNEIKKTQIIYENKTNIHDSSNSLKMKANFVFYYCVYPVRQSTSVGNNSFKTKILLESTLRIF